MSLCLFLSAFAFILAGPSHAWAESPSPRHTLEHFYRWVLDHPGAALPNARGRAQLAPLLSPQLVGLLKDAAGTEARCHQTVRKDHKPLILEGDLFVGNHEGATEVAYGTTSQLDNGMLSMTMTLLYVDKRFPKAKLSRTVSWVDKVRLRQEERGRWLVHDIVFGQAGDRSLVNGLQAYIAEGAKICVVERP